MPIQYESVFDREINQDFELLLVVDDTAIDEDEIRVAMWFTRESTQEIAA